MAKFVKKYQNGNIIPTRVDKTYVKPPIKPILKNDRDLWPKALIERGRSWLNKRKQNKAQLIKTHQKRRNDLNSSIDLIVANDHTSNKDGLKKLLTLTSWMENSHGHNDNAYNRTYTNSQMSLDNIALNNMLNKRTIKEVVNGQTIEKEGNYSTNQKAYFERMKKYNLNKDNITDSLKSDNSDAAIFMTRFQYGQTNEPLPTGDNYEDYYNYFKTHYNKGGTPISDEDKAQFKRGWDMMMSGDLN